jgi:hypothetical protein
VREGEREREGGRGGESVRMIVRGRGEIEGKVGLERYKERNGGRVEEREGWGYSESDTNNEREK